MNLISGLGLKNEGDLVCWFTVDEFDFAYITLQIQFVANEFSEGKVISVLEGGYNTSGGIISSFAQSVFTHVRFLNSSINMLYYHDKYLFCKKKWINEEKKKNKIFDKKK